jgi:hypothetical protein
VHGLGREAGEVAFREGGRDGGGVGRGFQGHFDGGLADGDAVAVVEGDGRVLAVGTLLRGLTFLAPATFFPVHVGAVHAAEVAQGRHGRAGFEEEMMTGHLWVAGHAKVAIGHPAEQEGVVLGEGEGAGGAVGVEDVEGDAGHGKSLKV